MDYYLIPGLITASAAILGCSWLSWQLLRQNGRILIRLEDFENRLDQLEFAVPNAGDLHAGMDQTPSREALPALTNKEETERTNRFSNHSLARSKIKRDGLKAGMPAPDFRLPCLDGRSELSLLEFRGRRVLMVFSSPRCAPCNELAPKLEKFHRDRPDLELVMISQGDPEENRAKVKEHELTFAVALQQGWAISRRYAIFATPAAYLIDQEGVITRHVAVGAEPILNLLASITRTREPVIP